MDETMETEVETMSLRINCRSN